MSQNEEQVSCQLDFNKKGNIATSETEHEIKTDGSFNRQKNSLIRLLEITQVNFQ